MMVVALLFASTSCHHEDKKEETGTFQVTSPIKKDTTISRDYVCQIHAISHIELRAQESGFIQEIYIDEGQFVKKGQALFQIMPNLYEAEVQKAEAEVAYTKTEFENTKILADSNIVSDNQLKLAKAKYDKALAELSFAQVHLGFTTVLAPFNGIIDRFHVRLGSFIEEGELLTNLSDNSEMWVYYNVSESEYLDFMMSPHSDSMKVSLMMANNKLFNHQGIVETIEADFNPETGNVAFRATFPNPDGLLRHGETGNVRMSTPIEDALLIPQKATFEILDKKYVYVVENNVIHSREIEVAAELSHLYVVSKGLSTTDIILLEGLRKVHEDEKIKSEFQDPEYVFSHLQLYAE